MLKYYISTIWKFNYKKQNFKYLSQKIIAMNVFATETHFYMPFFEAVLAKSISEYTYRDQRESDSLQIYIRSGHVISFENENLS